MCLVVLISWKKSYQETSFYLFKLFVILNVLLMLIFCYYLILLLIIKTSLLNVTQVMKRGILNIDPRSKLDWRLDIKMYAFELRWLISFTFTEIQCCEHRAGW